MLAVLAATSLSAAPLQTASKPNIIYILADDLGWADVGYHGSPIPTPNLDRLAREGVEFDRHYVAPVCSPTRAGLLTGRLWSRFGITVPNSRQCLPDHTPTLGSVLKEEGYATALIGKWHLGGAEYPHKHPKFFGFDHTYGSLDGAVHPYTHVYTGGGKGGDDGLGLATWHRNGEFIKEEGHVTDLLTADALRFINENKDNPFFLYLPYTAPHEKCLDEPEWMEKVRHLPQERQAYAAMVAHMDHDIGKIVAELDSLGLREKTLLVFSSDNGGIFQGRNDPLRKTKGSPYEGGVRVAAFANWPGHLSPSKLETPVCVIDWLPTVCALTGALVPDNVDGKNIWPLLTGVESDPPARPIYLKGLRGNSYAFVYWPWKLVWTKNDGTELFNLKNDPTEFDNLVVKKPEKVREMESLLAVAKKTDNDNVASEVSGDGEKKVPR